MYTLTENSGPKNNRPRMYSDHKALFAKVEGVGVVVSLNYSFMLAQKDKFMKKVYIRSEQSLRDC